MNVLITGSSGFLGSLLIEELSKLTEINKIISYDIVDGFDILDQNQFENQLLINNITHVIHLAAMSNLNIYAENPELGYKINVIATRNILALCHKYDIRLLFASTCCIYGNNNIHPSDETSLIAPTELYAKSKAISEKDILEIGLPHICMRLATFYGENMRGALAPAIFIDKSYNNLQIQIHGNGKQTRTLTYVSDIVTGIIKILLSPPIYTIINVTNTEEISVLCMVKVCQDVVNNHAEVVHIDDRNGQIYQEQILNDRLKQLGWEPKINFVEGIRLSFESYKRNGYKWLKT